jgi:hypothetical protein
MKYMSAMYFIKNIRVSNNAFKNGKFDKMHTYPIIFPSIFYKLMTGFERFEFDHFKFESHAYDFGINLLAALGFLDRFAAFCCLESRKKKLFLLGTATLCNQNCVLIVRHFYQRIRYARRIIRFCLKCSFF